MPDTIATAEELDRAVRAAVARTEVADMHTHLYAPAFGDLLLRGVDELLTYHYLIAEVLRVSPLTYEEYWKLDAAGQAEHIWRELFLERTPCSEACRGVLTALRGLGLDPGARDLAAYREWCAGLTPEKSVDLAFAAARVREAVMTNDPFDDRERAVWLSDHAGAVRADPRFRAALRIDPLLLDWERRRPQLAAWGYEVEGGGDRAFAEAKRFLVEWGRRMGALYMAVSLPPDFAYPDDSMRTRLLDACVLPACRELGIPFALMIGVRRQVNPELRLAGDMSGAADLRALARLCAKNPHNRFFATLLARENQHELAVLARKFRNLMIFGCWWFLNNPTIVGETTRMRAELLGTSFIPQHSDARVLEQVVYKWSHARAVIADALCEQYRRVLATGWRVERAEIERDVRRLLRDNFWDFVRGA